MSQNVSSNSSSIEQQFQAGLSSLQQKNWDSAIQSFQQALDQSPVSDQAGVIYHNMSLAAFQKGDILTSYIWAKKSATLAPNYKAAENNLTMLSSKIETPLVNHEISAYEQMQKMGLQHISYDALAFIAIFLALIAAYLFSKFFLKKKQIDQDINFEDSDLGSIKTKFPWLALLCTLASAFFLTLANLKWSEINTPKAIISTEMANLQSNPGENQAVILQLKAATEVEVLNRLNTSTGVYVQVRYPGAFSGWIKKSDLIILKDVP